MPLRDLLLTLIILGALPMILMRPPVGVLVWSWIGYMNPHRLVWSFAQTFPWAQLVAGITLVAMVIRPGDKRLPRDALVYVLIAFSLWMVVTTVFAYYPEEAWAKLSKVLKIQLMTLITLVLIKEWRYLQALIWVIVLSLGFYGVKGGIFTLATGAQFRVRGPEHSFIEGNTVIGMAMLMALPLMHYLQANSESRWVRVGLWVAMALTAIAILGTYSRGAFLGAAVMALFLVWKSPHRVRLLLAGLVVLIPFFAFLPQQWFTRMGTIQNYEQDLSASSRILAWRYSLELAKERPLTGFGFNPYTRENYQRFAPEIDIEGRQTPGAHSNYFKALGEHGLPGLGLYLLSLFLGYRKASWIIRHSRNRPDLKWAGNLAAMVQVSLVAYAVSGAFLNMTYFDMYYHLLAILVMITVVAGQELSPEKKAWAGKVPVPRPSANSGALPRWGQ